MVTFINSLYFLFLPQSSVTLSIQTASFSPSLMLTWPILQCSSDSSASNKTVIPPPETENFLLCFNIICFVFCLNIQLLYTTVKELTKDKEHRSKGSDTRMTRTLELSITFVCSTLSFNSFF